MGRMLEALGQSREKQVQPPAPANLQAQPDPSPEATRLATNECSEATAVSYIEVGGPRSVIDASPDVLAATPKPRPKPSPEKAPSPPNAETKPAVTLDEIAGTIAIWCSWTLRGGAREQSAS